MENCKVIAITNQKGGVGGKLNLEIPFNSEPQAH